VSTFLSIHSRELIGIPLTLMFNALLVACEFSLIKVRFSHFNRDLQDKVKSNRSLGSLVADGDRTIRVLRIGLTACLMLYSLFSFPLFRALFSFSGLELAGLTPVISAVLAFVVSLTLHQFVGELFARGVGLSYPLQSLRFGAPFIRTLGWLTRPINQVVQAFVGLLWVIWRKEPLPDLDSLELETQIELLRKEAPEMSMVAQLIFKNTILLRDLVVSDVLLPRNQVKYFDLNLPLKDNLRIAQETGHTRFPLCFGDLDRCLGLIHIKDIFLQPDNIANIDLRKIKRNMIRIDLEEPLETALSKLLSHRMHMALVIDEFRGTEGVLTLERILEQLVGEIRDEFDADEEELIKADLNTDEAVVSGLTPLHEIESTFDVELDREEVSTIGGLITSELGRIPEAGERLRIGPLDIEVAQVDETRVVEVRLHLLSPEDEMSWEDAGPDSD